MPLVLNAGASVICPHGGTVQVMASQTAVKAGGQPVLVQGDLDGKPVAGCTLAPSPAGTKPCTTATSMGSGAATKLKVGGKPALLDTASGPTDSNPPGMWRVVSAGQTTVSAS